MRNLMLCCVLAVAFIAGVGVILTPARADATITVTTTQDTIDSDGLCSLREAIIAANDDSPFSDCPGGSGADTIAFDPGLSQPAVFVLTNTGSGEDGALTGDLDITGRLTISGAGQDLTIIDGNGSDRVFEVLGNAQATLSGVTVRNGNPGAPNFGGGIAVDLTGALTLTHSAVMSNTAIVGGGVQVWGVLTASDSTLAANQGGGISSDGGRVTLNQVDVVNNSGGYGVHSRNQATLNFDGGLVGGNAGGGIANSTSTATLNDLSITGNTVGGGVHNSGFTLTRLTLQRCAVISNTASSGAGIYNEGVGAQASILNTSISSNTATLGGGGIFNNGVMSVDDSTIAYNQARTGGGIDHRGGTLHLTNDTVSSNTASDNGGGIYNGNGVFLTNLTVYANTAQGNGGGIFNDESRAYPANTIFAMNLSDDGNCSNSELAALVSQGHNLDSDATCSLTATGDVTATNPLLGPLQDNGGPATGSGQAAFTHALLPGSPAIDGGDDGACPGTDQRGLARPQGAACDIGAYEFGETTDLSISKTRQGSGDVVAGERVTFTLTITNAGPTTPVTATVVDTWTPVGAVVGVHAPGCDVNLGGGVITCTRSGLGLGSALLPDPHVVFTTSAAFSGTLANSASVSPVGGIDDVNLSNDASGPVLVTIWAGETPPDVYTDLSISKTRQGAGSVVAGEHITFTLTVTNAGPTTPVTATVVDTWTPVGAVVGVHAPGCDVDLGGGVITCTRSGLGLGSALLPDPHVVFTTSAAFSGTLTSTASVASGGDIDDTNPANNVSAPLVVAIIRSDWHSVYLPVVLR